MALEKVTYVDGVTIIGAKNLNDIQDELIRQGEQQTEDEESMEAALALKADKETTYTKTEVDTALALKADKSDTFTKAEVNSALALKADKSDTYTKTEVNEALDLKSDKAETYTKAQVDGIVEDAIAEAVKESEYSNFEMKSVSGDFVHITDGAGLIPVKDLKIGIEAVQDLHGYDAPWVGGAGKNIFNNTASTTTLNGVTFTVNADGSVTVTGTATADTNFQLIGASALESLLATGQSYVLSGTPNGGSSDTYFMRLNVSGKNDIGDGIVLNPYDGGVLGNWSIRIASGYAISGSLLFKPMIEKGSVKTDYAPYANICPISGWTGAKVSVNGINQWDEEWELGGYNTSTGAKTGTSDRIRSKNYISVLPSTSYCIRANSGGGAVLYYDNSKTFISSEVAGWGVQGGAIFTTPSNCKYITFTSYSNYGTTYNHDISINYPSTDHDYHAYNGHTYSVTWQTEAGTVYGGTLDVTMGVLTVTHELWTLAPSDWTASTTYLSNITQLVPEKYRITQIPMCDSFKGGSPKGGGNLANGEIAITVNLQNISAHFASQADRDTWLSGSVGTNTLMKLAEPQTYQLTPTEVLTLLGENNIFADTGAIEELIYRISRQ